MSYRGVFIGKLEDVPTVSRNKTDREKKKIFEKLIKSGSFEPTDSNVEIKEDDDIIVVPNPKVNGIERRLQPSVYKGPLNMPDKIKNKLAANP